MNENIGPKSDTKQNENINEILSSEKWKDACKKAAYLMRLARKNKKEHAIAYNSKAQKILPILVIVLAVMTILI